MIKTILLADDSITMQKVIRLTFASGGYKLITADNGDEAIKKAEELKPNIVLVDAALPGRNGYEICETIKNNSNTHDTPVIILAGTFNPLDDEKARHAGADDSIIKPFESRQLTEKVEHLLKRYPSAEGAPSTGTLRGDEPEWAENDVIRAPEPFSSADEPLTPSTDDLQEDTISATPEMPDLEVLEGRGIIEEAAEKIPSGLSSETADEGEAPIPDMITADGELEGEGGFDIEGFEINPFKSEPLREKTPFEQPDDSLKAWNVDEDDVIGFNDLETETEIESETLLPSADTDEGVLADDEPSGDTIEIEEELSVAEEHETADTEPVMPSEELVRELVSKVTLEVVEDIVRSTAPGLIKEAMEEAVREKTPELMRGAMEETVQEKTPELMREAMEEAVREKTPELMREAMEETVREKTPELMREAMEETVREKTPELMRKAMEEAVREKTPELMREAMEEEMERIKRAIKDL